MKHIACILFGLLALPQLAQSTDVGVSISVGDPGFFGHIDIGNVPRPVVVYPEPIIVEPVPIGVVREPMYLHVPPGQAKKWKSYCHQYNACGQPVYFVQDSWYNDVYVPEYHKAHGGGHKEHGEQGNQGKNGKHKHGNQDH